MTGRAIRITSRIAFIICGIISLFTCVPYLMMRGTDLPVQSEWIAFVIALVLAGGFSLTIAVLPRLWIAKAFRTVRDDDRPLLSLLKWLGCFAAFSYLVAVIAYVAPNRWNLNPQLMFLLCPMYFIKLTFDPSLVVILFVLAPMNAGVSGALGVILGYGRMLLGKRG